MSLGKHSFRDLNTLIDCVHSLFDEWEQNASIMPGGDDQLIYRIKLAVHEWLANLVQHADFGEREPAISMEVVPNGHTVRCVIEDNSRGFDLDAELDVRQEVLNVLPDRGMGLLMLKSCTDSLSYRAVDTKLHRLEFVVSANGDPWFEIPF